MPEATLGTGEAEATKTWGPAQPVLLIVWGRRSGELGPWTVCLRGIQVKIVGQGFWLSKVKFGQETIDFAVTDADVVDKSPKRAVEGWEPFYGKGVTCTFQIIYGAWCLFHFLLRSFLATALPPGNFLSLISPFPLFPVCYLQSVG